MLQVSPLPPTASPTIVLVAPVGVILRTQLFAASETYWLPRESKTRLKGVRSTVVAEPKSVLKPETPLPAKGAPLGTKVTAWPLAGTGTKASDNRKTR